MKRHKLLKLDYDPRRKKVLAVCTCWHKESIEPSSLIGLSQEQKLEKGESALYEHKVLNG